MATEKDLLSRLPPWSREAEQCVLGSMLRDNATIDDVVLSVAAEDFYGDGHRKVFDVAVSLAAGGGAADLVTLAEELLRRGWLDDAGGYAYLAELWDAAPTAANAEYYARIVKNKSVLRALIRAANEVLKDAYAPGADAGEVLAGAERAVFALAERGAAAGVVTLAEAVEAACDKINARTLANAGPSGLPTGVGALDRLTAGLHPSELTVVAARPGVGKTAVALAVAANVSRGGGRVLVSSLEMSAHELATRMLVSASGVSNSDIRDGSLNRADLDALLAARGELVKLPVCLDDSAEQPVLRVAANARRMKRQGGLALVVVDYLQLVAPDDRRLPRHEQVAGISRRLKALAKELATPVLALAQLNRESEARSGAKPKLSDLRESGSIEADADVVVLLHKNASGPDDALECIVAKNRNGPVGEVAVRFDRARMRFSDLASGANW